MFKGEKLQEIRLLHGMSRAELANKIDVSEQAIWQFETNKVNPKISPTVISMAKLFRVNINFFESKTILPQVDSGKISFRNYRMMSRKYINMQVSYVNTIHFFISYLNSYLTSISRVIYSLIEEVDSLINEQKIDIELIKKVAMLARKKLDISDNNDNLLFKLELSGVNILSRVMSKESGGDSYSLWTNDNVPYIILSFGKSYARRNFDLAHELGHLLIHRAVDFEVLDSYDSEIREQQAHEFALDFLLPDDKFRNSFDSIIENRVSQPDRYIPMKETFGVSIKTLEYKAFKLGYLTPAQNSYFCRQMTNKKYNEVEPLDRETPVYSSGKILSMIDIILKNNLMDFQSIINILSISKGLLAELLNVDLSFFDKYQNSGSGNGNIVRLSDAKRGKGL